VLKFQFDDACFQTEMRTKFNGKVDEEEKENKKKEWSIHTSLQHRHKTHNTNLMLQLKART